MSKGCEFCSKKFNRGDGPWRCPYCYECWGCRRSGFGVLVADDQFCVSHPSLGVVDHIDAMTPWTLVEAILVKWPQQYGLPRAKLRVMVRSHFLSLDPSVFVDGVRS